MIYGNRLKFLRERDGITQEKLGEYIGVTKQAFNHFEKEYTIIPVKHLNDICNYFDVSLDYIFNFTEIKMYDNYDKSIHTDFMVKRLKEFRKENKLSQEKLASILNVAKGTIGNYESNRGIIATPFFIRFVKNIIFLLTIS